MKRTFGCAIALALLFGVTEVSARSRGVVGTDCGGCHGYEGGSTLEISPTNVQLGESAVIRFSVRDSGAEVAGVYVGLEEPSQFSLGSRSGLAVVSGGVTHTSPRSFSNGVVTYELNWTVPDSPGATRFSVGWVSGNGNGSNNGDEGHSENFDIVYGCEAQTYFRDFDGDGFGRSDLPREFCAGEPPAGYATQGGDCFEGSDQRYPGATELCNQRDDDCDGEIDEGAIPVELYPDADGDGFYSANERASGDVVMGCVPTPGYAAEGGDCDADNAHAHPEAEEVCDLFTDEDCNGRVDDRVRPRCGVGWCVRESFSCSEADCVPGLPLDETCNFIDDDCDGIVDEGDLCEAGLICAAGECRQASEVSFDPAAPEQAGGGTGAPENPEPSTDPKLVAERSGSNRRSTPAAACSLARTAPSSPLALLLMVAVAGLVARRRLWTPVSGLSGGVSIALLAGGMGCTAELSGDPSSEEAAGIGGAGPQGMAIVDPPIIEQTREVPSELEPLVGVERCVPLLSDESLFGVDPNGIAWLGRDGGTGYSFRTYDYQQEAPGDFFEVEISGIVAAQFWGLLDATFLTQDALWSFDQGHLVSHTLPIESPAGLCGDPLSNGAVLAAGRFSERRVNDWWGWEPEVPADAALSQLIDVSGECYDRDGNAWLLGADARLWRVSSSDVQLLFSDALSVAASAQSTGVLASDDFYFRTEDWQRWTFPSEPPQRLAAAGDAMWLQTAAQLLRFDGQEFLRLERSASTELEDIQAHSGGVWTSDGQELCHYETQDSLRVYGMRPGERAERENWDVQLELRDGDEELEVSLNGQSLDTAESDGDKLSLTLTTARVGWNALELVQGSAERTLFFKREPAVVRSWAEDVAPISVEACGECHSPGGDAEEFPLVTYEQWVSESAEIRRRVVETGTMPPVVAPGWESEIQVISEWLEGGTNP